MSNEDKLKEKNEQDLQKKKAHTLSFYKKTYKLGYLDIYL